MARWVLAKPAWFTGWRRAIYDCIDMQSLSVLGKKYAEWRLGAELPTMLIGPPRRSSPRKANTGLY